ncbi:DUF5723 family protein [Fodinibius halophilus]|uniref:DUF5723 domain-containing protein n=1 Tax=Fodinibius halophilus TaxID=1736908 RepID=A0A6M1T8H7_9BACT|nr:DUF5723 family protein [Fodinibius halophilus]NGP88893.1 hypothetical protein [Fodinibius halophilus]
MNFLKRSLSLFIAVVIIGSWSNITWAQSGHFSSASLGMGGTGAAYIDTYHANFINPANLMLYGESKPNFGFGLIGGLSTTAGGGLVNIAAYNKHFTGGNVVNADAVLQDFFGSGADAVRGVGIEFDLIPFGAYWRGKKSSFSLAVRNRNLSNISINRGFAEVALAGVNRDRFGSAKPVNFSSEVVAFSEISAGYSMKLLQLPSLGFAKNIKLYAGIAPKYIIPHATSSIDFESTIEVTQDKIVQDFNYTFETIGSVTDQFKEFSKAKEQENFDGKLGDFIEPDESDFTEVEGSGFGFDLGGTVEMDLAGPLEAFFSWIKGKKKLRVGLSVTDIGSVTYTNNAGTFSNDSEFVWDGIDLDDGFSDAYQDSVANDIYLNYKAGNKEEIVKKLPTKVHLGSHLQLGKLAVALDFTKGMNKVGMNSKRLAMGFGVEYDFFNFLPLRAGYRTGGATSSSITAGTGLEFRNFEFSVGALMVPNSENRGAGYGAAWSGLLFRF